MEHAGGRYIGIVDSDDYIEPDMYDHLFSIMESSDYDYVKCNYIVHRPLKKGCIIERLNFLSNVRYLAHIPLDYMNHSTSVYEHPELLLGETYIWNGLYRKSFLDVNHIRVNETQGAAWQDIGFSIHMLLCARKIFITDQYFNHYRLGREGNSTDNPNKLNYIYQEWKRVLDEFPIPDNEQITDIKVLVDAATDNDMRLWGGTFCGIDIIAPELAVHRYGGDIFIVANKYHDKDIRHQLQCLGIGEDSIIVFEP